MKINADFSQRVAVHASRLSWGTSIVRYAPGSHFWPYTHGGGEESLVLEGVFQDERGAFPAGSYVVGLYTP